MITKRPESHLSAESPALLREEGQPIPPTQPMEQEDPGLEAGATGREAQQSPNPELNPAVEAAKAPIDERLAFEKKYAGKTQVELEIAFASLDVLRRHMQKDLMESRRKAGLYTRFYPEPDQPIDVRALTMTEADRAIPNPNHAYAGSMRGGDENGRAFADLITLPHGAYPEFDALQAEEIWLQNHIKQN
jgi:hypothetical protein